MSIDLSYLKAPIKSYVSPPISGTVTELPIEDLEWADFEKLCLRIIETSYGIHDCEIYGIKGQAQEGIDIFARKNNNIYANYQCKRYKEFPSNRIEEVVKEFRRGKWFYNCDEFVLCTTCALNKTEQQDKFNELKDALNKEGITFMKWDKLQLSRILKAHPQIVYDFFGKEWVRAFNGDEAVSAIKRKFSSPITKSLLEEGFRKISLLLESADYDIPEIGFIKRTETTDLIKWINSPLQQNQAPIAVLEGGAGLGKTAILRNTLLELRTSSIPVLALKADRIFAPTYLEFLYQVSDVSSLDNPIEAIRKFVLKENSTLVILIDQLDALSQSLSTNRKLLNTYRELIKDLASIPGLRIIISCRTFDLETDPLLQSYKGKVRFKVKLLDEQQVQQAINKSAFTGLQISPTLLELLKTPLHLRIFCQLNSATDIGGITTLQELYTSLYEQKILHPDQGDDMTPINPILLIDLLYAMAQGMYAQQQLTIPLAKFQNKYISEVKYALSQNLLSITGNGKQLQFFHQSFFDYLFARKLVEGNEKLTSLLKGAHQGLFVRSAVSQVLNYLREYDISEYLHEVKQILFSPNEYRYHIRLLVYQQLGQITAPSNVEKNFVKQKMLSSSGHRNLFVESIQSRGWAKWLCEQGFILELLQRQADLLRSEDQVLWHISINQPDLVLEQLEKIELNEITNQRCSTILSFISHTTAPAYEKIFDIFKVWILDNVPHIYYHVLSYRAQLSPKWIASELLEALKNERNNKPLNRGNHQEWELKEAVEHLFEYHPEIGFKLAKELVEYWVEEARYDKLPLDTDKEEQKTFIGDTEFTNFDPQEEYRTGLTQEVYSIFYKYLTKVSKEDPALIRVWLENWSHSNMTTLIKLSAAAFLANPSAYIEEIFSLLIRPNLLMEVEIRSHLNYYLCKLIFATYNYLNARQKIQLHSHITSTLTVNDWYNSSHETYSAYEPKRFLRTYYGKLTYSYLSAIPDVENNPSSNIRRLYQQLNRRYGKINCEIRPSISWRSGDPSPITTIEAERLKAKDWLSTFRAHQLTADVRPFDDYEAGLGRTFREEVKKAPNKFKLVLESLLDEQSSDISSSYLVKGLEGFSEADADLDCEYFEVLVLDGIAKGKIDYKSHTGISLLGKCIREGVCHVKVVELLADVVASHLQDEHSVTGDSVDELMDGINCVGGMAANALANCYEMRKQTSLITKTLQSVALVGSGAVRAATLYRLAFLLNLYSSPAPVISLYLSLVGTNYRLIKAAEWSLSFLIQQDFTALIPQFKAAISEPLCHESVAKILCLAWAKDKDQSHELLKFYWTKSEIARSSSLRYLMDPYPELSNIQKLKVRLMFSELMNYNTKELRDAFSFCFYRLQPSDFEEWFPLLKNYVNTPVSKGREGSFYDYLQSCVQEYPAECIELTSFFDSHDKPNIQKNDIRQKPLELLLSAYQVLAELDSQSPLLETAMDVFDKMLQNDSYRLSSNSKLEMFDRY